MTSPVNQGYSVYCTRGQIAANENDYLWVPNKLNSKNKYGVVLCHGRGVPDEFMTAANARTMVAYLARAGFACVAGEFGGNQWGNNTAVARIDAAFTYLKSKVSGLDANKFHIMGISMGGGTAIRYAQSNPSKIVTLHAFLPVTSIRNIYEGNLSGLQAEIATAWGVTAPAALPAAADLLANASSLNNIPTWLYHAGNDTLINANDITALQNATKKAQVKGPIGTSGHSDASIGQIGLATNNWQDVIQHLEQYQ